MQNNARTWRIGLLAVFAVFLFIGALDMIFSHDTPVPTEGVQGVVSTFGSIIKWGGFVILSLSLLLILWISIQVLRGAGALVSSFISLFQPPTPVVVDEPKVPLADQVFSYAGSRPVTLKEAFKQTTSRIESAKSAAAAEVEAQVESLLLELSSLKTVLADIQLRTAHIEPPPPPPPPKTAEEQLAEQAAVIERLQAQLSQITTAPKVTVNPTPVVAVQPVAVQPVPSNPQPGPGVTQ